LRELLARDDIDAAVIATGIVGTALCRGAGRQAGKDIYLREADVR